MKKIFYIFIVVFIGIFSFALGKISKDENEIVNEKKTYENVISMMLEKEGDSGEYELTTRSEWPTEEDGYVFNSELSKCENGGELSWDNENNIVVMSGNVADKCYVYFDKIITYIITYPIFSAIGIVTDPESAKAGEQVKIYVSADGYDCNAYFTFSYDEVIEDMYCTGSIASAYTSKNLIGFNLNGGYCTFTMPAKNIVFNVDYEPYRCIS